MSAVIENKISAMYTFSDMKKIYFSVVWFFSVVIFSLHSAQLPFDGTLSQKELDDLTGGKILVRTIDKYKNMSIKSSNKGAEKLRAEIKDLNPNYLAEVIQVKPYKGNEDLIRKFRGALEDISSYAGIQYWYVQHERYYDLYSTAAVVGKTEVDENTVRYSADLEMQPFGMIHMPIIIEETDDYLF